MGARERQSIRLTACALQTDIGYSPKITLPYAAYAKSKTAAVAVTNSTAQIGVRPHHAPDVQLA